MPESNLVGRFVADRYRVIRLIARGGMASVYLAEDERLEREVALKVIHSHLAEDSSFRQKFIREAKIAARLSHPNLVNVFDQGQDGNLIFMAMEYVPGITLRDALNQFGSLTPERALELFEPVMAALAAAHSAGILHRDLKPENVFLSDDGRVKLGDFGLARSISANTQTGSLIGTVAYLSPELVTRGIADARSDVYAAGIMLFELLTGKQPYEGERAVQIAYQHANDQVPAPSKLNPQVPEVLDEVVLWATAREPRHRPANAGSLLAVIQQVRSDLRDGTSRSIKKLEQTRRLDELRDLEQLGASATEVIGASGLGLDPNSSATEIFDDGLDLPEPLEPLEALAERRRRNGRAIAIVTVLCVLLGLGGGWYFASGPGALASVPNLQNRTVQQAKELLSPYSVQVSTAEENSPSISRGFVIRSEPAAGSLLWPGTPLKLIVSKGAKLASVPDLVGAPAKSARATLRQAGFDLGTVEQWFNEAPIGTVFDHFGSGGKKVAVGSSVNIQVSLGPLPTVEGLSQESAIETVQSAGLKVSQVVSEFSETTAKGLALSIAPDTDPIGRNGQVTLKVSKGTAVVIMPVVVGETLSAAKNLLESLGLNVRVNTDQLQANWGLVKVKSASQGSGARLRAGDTVTISNFK